MPHTRYCRRSSQTSRSFLRVGSLCSPSVWLFRPLRVHTRPLRFACVLCPLRGCCARLRASCASTPTHRSDTCAPLSRLRGRSLASGRLALPLSVLQPSFGRLCSVRGRAVPLPSSVGVYACPAQRRHGTSCSWRLARLRGASLLPLPPYSRFRGGSGFFAARVLRPLAGACLPWLRVPFPRRVSGVLPPLPPAPAPPLGASGGPVPIWVGLRPPTRVLRFSQPSRGSPRALRAPPVR